MGFKRLFAHGLDLLVKANFGFCFKDVDSLPMKEEAPMLACFTYLG